MNKELIGKIKKESFKLVILFVIILVAFKIVFYKENFLIVARTVASFFWLFVLPGFFLMYYWHEKINFLERFMIGIAFSASIIGIASYNLGLLGLHTKYHGILLPFACLALAAFIIWRKYVKTMHK